MVGHIGSGDLDVLRKRRGSRKSCVDVGKRRLRQLCTLVLWFEEDFLQSAFLRMKKNGLNRALFILILNY